jgi:hypothetical protein
MAVMYLGSSVTAEAARRRPSTREAKREPLPAVKNSRTDIEY